MCRGTEDSLRATVGGAEALSPTTSKKLKANNDANLEEDPSPVELESTAQPWLTPDYNLVKDPEAED